MKPRGAPGAPDRIPDPMRRSVVTHYESKLREHGPTARGMDWKDEASQRLRFEVLLGIGELSGKSVHEVGAGAGHLLDYLRVRRIRADYSGSDLSEAMVETARRAHPGARFEVRDLLEEPADPTWDVLVCSGLFHVKLDNQEEAWAAFVRAMIRRMYERCRVGIAFNLMSDRVDYRVPGLYYSNPSDMLDFCLREIGGRVTLRHDYPLHEYTVYVYRALAP